MSSTGDRLTCTVRCVVLHAREEDYYGDPYKTPYKPRDTLKPGKDKWLNALLATGLDGVLRGQKSHNTQLMRSSIIVRLV